MKSLSGPIFFIGVPRSGTTVIFESFARHEMLGWPSNYSRKFPSLPKLGLILRLTDNKFINLSGQKKQYNHVMIANKVLPKPAEAYEFWNHYTEIDFARQYLVDQSATPECINRLNSAVSSILYWEGKKVFSAKLTGPSRIHFLRSVFPDAKFIHVVRDGRAVVHSMLNSSAWSSRNFLDQPWWKGGLTDTDIKKWNYSNKNPAVLAALQWNKIIDISQQESIECNKNNYQEIKYEQFIESPYNSVKKLYDWCNLP
ncbi:MAG: sulfotransferase, partial [Methylococcales bacterium]